MLPLVSIPWSTTSSLSFLECNLMEDTLATLNISSRFPYIEFGREVRGSMLILFPFKYMIYTTVWYRFRSYSRVGASRIKVTMTCKIVHVKVYIRKYFNSSVWFRQYHHICPAILITSRQMVTRHRSALSIWSSYVCHFNSGRTLQ